MPVTKMLVELKVDSKYAGALLEEVIATVNQFEDSIKCPSRSKTGERCELDIDHTGKLHNNGTLSWPDVPGVQTIHPGYGADSDVAAYNDISTAIGREVVAKAIELPHYWIAGCTPSHVFLAVKTDGVAPFPVPRVDFWGRYRLAE